MPRRRIDLVEHFQYAEGRYHRYTKSARTLLADADQEARSGNWPEAANKLHAALENVASATGVCRELHLITMLRED